MVESLAPKLQLNQQSYRSMEVSKLEPAPSIEVEEVRLPPASKLYRKIFKSFDKEKEEKPLVLMTDFQSCTIKILLSIKIFAFLMAA